jgi:hypothetical protein
MSMRWKLALVIGMVAGVPASEAMAQAGAHAMVVTGLATHPGGGAFDCATSGPQTRERTFFGTGVGLPTESYSYCNLAGGISDVSGAINSGAAYQSGSAGFPGDTGTASLVANASASINELHVSASGTNSAKAYGGAYYAGAEAAAYSSDKVIFDGTGQQLMRFEFSVDGAMTQVGTSEGLLRFAYQIGSDPIYGGLTGYLRSTDTLSLSGQGDLTGFLLTPGSISGSGTVYTFDTLVNLGVATDFNIGLYVAVYPGWNGGSSIDADFSHTLRLSGIKAVGSDGSVLDTVVTGLGSSGYLYDANGSHLVTAAVPEPATWTMMIVGFGAIGGAIRRRKINKNLQQTVPA